MRCGVSFLSICRRATDRGNISRENRAKFRRGARANDKQDCVRTKRFARSEKEWRNSESCITGEEDNRTITVCATFGG